LCNSILEMNCVIENFKIVFCAQSRTYPYKIFKICGFIIYLNKIYLTKYTRLYLYKYKFIK